MIQRLMSGAKPRGARRGANPSFPNRISTADRCAVRRGAYVRIVAIGCWEFFMRTLAVAAAALLLSGTAALAAPASVTVTVGPKLQAKADKTYGAREVDQLATDLRRSVERQLARTGAYDGARVDLVLVDAVPNRPTFKQMSDTPGLSLRSFGVGGAKIEGRTVAADGKETPLNYSYYQPDIREAHGASTWSDAQWTIDRFAYRLGKGEAVASR
jgi:hypothetical protein